MAAGTGMDGKSLVLQAVDIVELISRTVSLKRRGRSYVGLCPFHQEKTPSFHVRPDRQYFICFGCKAAGNAIDFVIKRDRVEFLEAMRSLAQQYNVDLPKLGVSRERQNEKQSIYDANAAAVMFFEKQLHDPATGSAALQYLQQRGFAAETLRRFHVGFAPEAWDRLLRSLGGAKLPAELLLQAGLVKARDGGTGHYDTFRNRILFPIRDENGRTVAFGGRVMPGSADPAKYLNSPETAVFSKSRCVFGLDLARQAVVSSGTAAIVEGYTDVLMAHQCGVENVVSVLGTALTEQHVAILRRFAERIVLLFDGDNAGDLAVNRAVELFLTQPVDIAIATLPDGMDPDEFVLQRGKDAFADLLAGATDALAYQWQRLASKFDVQNDLTAQQKAVSGYLDLLAGARANGPVDSIRWGMALARVQKLTGIPEEDLRRRFATIRSPRQPTTAAQAADPGVPKSEAPRGPTPPAVATKAERWLLGVLLHDASRWDAVQVELQPEEFLGPDTRLLAERVWDHHRHEGPIVVHEWVSELDDALRSLVFDVLEEVEALRDLDVTLTAALDYFRAAREQREEAKLTAALVRSNSESDDKAAGFEAFVKKHRPDLRRLPRR